MGSSDFSSPEEPDEYSALDPHDDFASLLSDESSEEATDEEEQKDGRRARNRRRSSRRMHNNRDDRPGQRRVDGSSHRNGERAYFGQEGPLHQRLMTPGAYGQMPAYDARPFYGQAPYGQPPYGQPPAYGYIQPPPYHPQMTTPWGYAGAPGPFPPPPPTEGPEARPAREHQRVNHPVQAPVYSQPPMHQQTSRFWDAWERYQSGADQQPYNTLVPARRPWGAYPIYPTIPAPKSLGPNAPAAVEASAALGPDHASPGELPRSIPAGVDTMPQRDPGRPIHIIETHPEHSFKRTGGQQRQDTTPAGAHEGSDSSDQGLDAKIVATRVDLVHDPSQTCKDMSVSLEMEMEEDWHDDLEEFCRLRRLGRIKEAKEHFRSTLEHVSSIPYIRVQYAEMLQSCGDYKGLRRFNYPPEFPPSEETPDARSRGKLAANYALLDILSQRPIDDYLTAAWGVVRNTLKALATETMFASTEIQLLALCLRVLHRLETCTHERVVGPVKVYAKCLFNWRKLYHDLVGDNCIWDFKDLFLAAVPVFGWEETFVQFLGTTYLPQAMETMVKDWSQPFFDEASVVGLLDIFTSLIIQCHSGTMKHRNALLLYHAGIMAESTEQNDPELMRSRPFIQWLLAKTILDLQPPPERPDEVRLEHFSGLRLNNGLGIQLPVYVPSRHTRKPDWDMFFSRATPTQQRVVEIASKAAEEIGDYNLQAECLKLRILQSQSPTPLMSDLAHLQLDIQGDRDGYMTTCLSRYLVAANVYEEAVLLRELEQPSASGTALYLEQCQNASLTWAWSMIRILLTSGVGDDDSAVSGDGGPSPFSNRGFSLDGSKLPAYVAEFARAELGIPVTASMGPLSLADLQGAGLSKEQVSERQQPDPVLRERFTRQEAKPIATQEPPNLWKSAAHGNWPEVPSYPGEGYGVPPQPEQFQGVQESVSERNPLLYLVPEEPDPLKNGVNASVKVAGWSGSWMDDATHKAEGVKKDSEALSKAPHQGQSPETSAGQAQGQQNAGDKKPDQVENQGQKSKEYSQDSNNAKDGAKSAGQEQEGATTAEDGAAAAQKGTENGRERSKSRNGRKKSGILKELERSEDGYGSPETKTRPGDDTAEKPQISVEDGMTKLNFPNDLLDGNGLTVLLRSRKEPDKLKAFIVEKGGIFETIAWGNQASHSHRRENTPSQPKGHPSEFNIRTTSVNFDAKSTSSGSTVTLPARTTADKDQGKEPQTLHQSPAPAAAATVSTSVADNNEEASYDPWFLFNPSKPSKKRKKGPEPATMMSGAADGGGGRVSGGVDNSPATVVEDVGGEGLDGVPKEEGKGKEKEKEGEEENGKEGEEGKGKEKGKGKGKEKEGEEENGKENGKGKDGEEGIGKGKGKEKAGPSQNQGQGGSQGDSQGQGEGQEKDQGQSQGEAGGGENDEDSGLPPRAPSPEVTSGLTEPPGWRESLKWDPILYDILKRKKWKRVGGVS